MSYIDFKNLPSSFSNFDISQYKIALKTVPFSSLKLFNEDEQKSYNDKRSKVLNAIKQQNCSHNLSLAVLAFAGICHGAFRSIKYLTFCDIDTSINLAKRMFVPVTSKSTNNFKVIFTADKAAKYGYFDILNDRIVVPKKRANSIFHEIGHAINSIKFGKKFQLLSLKLPYYSFIPLLLSAPDTIEKNKKDKKVKALLNTSDFIKKNCGLLAFAFFVPQLFEEGAASYRALKFLHSASKPLFRKNLISLALAWGTYFSNAAAVSVCLSSLVTRLDKFYLQKSMFNDFNKAKNRLEFDSSVAPRIAVIDEFDKKSIKIDYDLKPDVSHGKAVVSILRAGLPNAKIKKYNTNLSEKSLCNALKKILDSEDKIDAINLSKASYISYDSLSKLTGFDVNSKNIASIKKSVRENFFKSKHKDAKVLREIIECMDKCSAKGIKVYIAAGNKSDNYFNLYTLADNAFVVGAINKYGSLQTFSARNSLVNRYARGVYRVKAVKDSNGHVIGFDINDDKKRDVSILKTTAKNKIPSVLPIRGTSFATPNAIVCDFQRVFVD